jgi:hypothetical protein
VSVYVLAAHAAGGTHASSYAAAFPYLVTLVIGVILGRLWGRRAGLKHLGEYEFRNRWRGAQSVRRY